MAGPLDFSQDGAAGAFGGGDPSMAGQSTGGVSVSDPGPGTSGGGSPSSGSTSQQPGDPATAAQKAILGGFNGQPLGPGADGQQPGTPATAAQKAMLAGGTANYNPPSTPSAAPRNQMAIDQAAFNATDIYPQNGFQRGGGFSFEDGGAVPDDTNGTPDQDQSIARALQSVDQVLQYTYSKYGLGGNEEDNGNAPIQTAGAMPMIPGNQSETPGPYKPQQPQPKLAGAMPMIPGNQSETPGPYVPQQPRPKMAAAMPMIPGNQSETPGPYKPGGGSKFADADGDDDGGAIDTNEDTA